MAARPVPHLLAAFSLAFGLGVMAAPARAQNYIGSGNVQVNMQVLDQLGGAGAAGPSATPQLPLIGSTGRAPKQAAAPVVAPLSGPQPLLGETGQPAAAIKLRRPGSSTATRKASATAPKAPAKAEVAPAGAPAAPAVAAAPAPVAPTLAAPTTPPAPAAPTPQAGVPTPVVPAPSAPPAAAAPSPAAPSPAAPSPAASAPAPAQATAPAPAATPAPAPSVAAAPSSPPAAAPTPAPAPAPQATARTPAPQVAAAPTPPRPVPAPGPASGPGPGGIVTLAFAGGQGELPSSGDLAALDALAAQYANGEDRLQIRAYAASTVSDGGSGARRLSLTRALAVRQYLIDKGIRSTRIDVRALGAPTDGSTADRVEVAPVGR